MRVNKSNKIVVSLLALSAGVTLMLGIPTIKAEAAPSAYVHNPVLNVSVMEDVIVDDTAVYGFRPDPNSVRLSSYADMDWTDPVLVEQGRQERIAYHNQYKTMYDTWKSMEAEGKSIEEIARTVSAMRNEIRLASYDGDPDGLARVKESNLAKYGNENGPTADSLFEKYGSWETVLIKAFSENAGMDACLGLYDIYYDNYNKVGSLNELSTQTYTVLENDSLAKIAAKYYGDRAEWQKIYDANKDIIKNPNLIYKGQQLVINVE